LGVVVYTLVHTPLRCGQLFRAGDFVFLTIFTRSEREELDNKAWLFYQLFSTLYKPTEPF